MRKRLLIIAAVVLLLLFGIALLARHHQQQHNKAASSNHTSSSNGQHSATGASGQSTQTNQSGQTSGSTSGNNPAPSTDTVTSAIEDQVADPSFQRSSFTVDNVNQAAPQWFIVKVTPTGTDQQVVVIRENSNGSLTVIAGPSGQFEASQFQPYNVPQSVLNQLAVKQ